MQSRIRLPRRQFTFRGSILQQIMPRYAFSTFNPVLRFVHSVKFPCELLSCRTQRSRSIATMVFKLSSVEDVEWFMKPVSVSGKVQRGFGRGSRDLGTPTANLPGHLLDDVPNAERDGVYFGFGCVPKYGNSVVKMVANVGRNITYDDVTERVLEAYLMSDIFDEEFYGEEMRLCIIGFMRPEWKFSSIDELIKHINNDIQVAKAALDLPRAKLVQAQKFLTE